MKEYRVTEKQLNQIKDMLDYMREASQEVADGEGINIANFERGMTALNVRCRELAYLVEDIEGQEAEGKANISDIVQAGKSIQAIANDIAQKMGMCDLPEGVKFEPKGEKIIKEVVF